MTSRFLALPLELAEQSLVYVNPKDIASASQVCKDLYRLIYKGDTHIWREVYLAIFDQPRQDVLLPGSNKIQKSRHFDWKLQLQRRVYARNVLLSAKHRQNLIRIPQSERITALQTIFQVVQNAVESSTASRDLDWVENILANPHGYDLYSTALPSHPSDVTIDNPSVSMAEFLSSPESAWGTPLPLGREEVLRARLRLYRGYTDATKKLVEASGEGDANMRQMARTRVYDMRRYTAHNSYGPLEAYRTGFVDWEQLDALLIVVSMNIHDHVDHEHQSCPHVLHPYGLQSSRLHTAPIQTALAAVTDVRDWAGITGNWRRLICFCDYRDLRMYNDMLSLTSRWPNNRRPSAIFEDEAFSEAVHVLSVGLNIDGVDYDAPESVAYPARPKLLISGQTSYQGSDMSMLTGSVYMTPDGAIRWDLTAEMEGEVRWSSLGVQIGAPGSAMGVLGIWTGVDHEPHDPAGPFWFWKVE